MRLKYALLAATLVAGGSGVALAQRASTYDMSQLPAVKGKVAQYLLTPRGEVDGLILADGTEVYVMPRLSTQLVFAVKPGDAVTIHGLKARVVPMVLGASITNDASGVTVTAGPRGPHAAMASFDVTGVVKEQLHSPRGDVDGVLLQDGTIVRLPPPEAQKLAAELAPGKSLYVQGAGYEGVLGKIIAARSLGADKDHMQTIVGPRVPGREGHMWGRGPMDGPGGRGGGFGGGPDAMGGPGGGFGGGPDGGAGPMGGPGGGPGMPPR